MPLQIEPSDELSTAKSDLDMDEELTEETEKPEERKILTSEHLAKLYVFALIWGMGAFLEVDDRRKYDVFLKETFTSLDIPKPDRKNPDVSIKR